MLTTYISIQLPALISSGFCGGEGVFLTQRREDFTQGAQGGAEEKNLFRHPAADRDFSLRSRQACRLTTPFP